MIFDLLPIAAVYDITLMISRISPERARPGLPDLDPAVGAPDHHEAVAAVQTPHRRHRLNLGGGRGRPRLVAFLLVVGVAAAPVVLNDKIWFQLTVMSFAIFKRAY